MPVPPGDAVYYVTGPASIFIRVPTEGAGPYKSISTLGGGIGAPGSMNTTNSLGAKFLGHCEVSPKPQFEAIYKEVKSSTSGEGVSDDKVFLGETAKVELDLARFNWTVANIVANFPRHARVKVPLVLDPPGTENYLDRGLLMIRNGMTFEMWIRHEFHSTINAAAYPDLPIGWYFPACITVGQYPDNLTRDTTKMKFFIEPQNVPIGVGGGWTLYSQDPALFATLPILHG